MIIDEIIEQPHPVLDKILKNSKKQIENSKWHVSQTLSDHLLKTKQEVKKIINSLGNKYLDYLNQKVDQNSKKDLLILVGLLHDIGKDVKGIRSETDEIYDPLKKGIQLKKTSYIGHEKAGGIAVISILEEIGFSKKEVEYLSQFITNHDYIHQAVESVYKGEDKEDAVKKVKNMVGELYPELLLQTLADLRGGMLDLIDKKEYDFREKLLLDLIQEQEQSGF
jgi:UTP:GlnB (protein PII) uridylyltransferase